MPMYIVTSASEPWFQVIVWPHVMTADYAEAAKSPGLFQHQSRILVMSCGPGFSWQVPHGEAIVGARLYRAGQFVPRSV